MKIEKFLKWIQEKLLNYPDIDFKTVKMFVDKFYSCLSQKERERKNITLLVQIITNLTLKQITIDSFVREIVIENLDNQLNDMKKDDSKE